MSADLAEIHVPPECREMIRRGALVSISTSGGKDSQAMTILLARIVPHDQLVAVHAPLAEVDWPGTIEHIEATLPVGVPLIFAPIASGKTLLERVEERGLWPSNSARWCTSDFKTSPIQRELRRYLKTRPRFGGRLVNAMGMRAQESPARARKAPWRRNDRMSVAGREVRDWLPIFDLTDRGCVPHHPRRRADAASRIPPEACRECPACSASWPRVPICVRPRNCNRISIAGTRRSRDESATRCRRRAFPCPDSRASPCSRPPWRARPTWPAPVTTPVGRAFPLKSGCRGDGRRSPWSPPPPLPPPGLPRSRPRRV